MSAPIFHLFAFGASVLMFIALLKKVDARLIALGAALALVVVHLSFQYESWQAQHQRAERAAAAHVGFINIEDYRKAQALGFENQRQYEEHLELERRFPFNR